MAAKKEDKLDKGFEEVPLHLDEGFEDSGDADKEMADAGINPSAPDAAAQLAARSPSKGPIDTAQRDALVRGLGKGVTFGQQAPLAGLGAAATQAVTGNQGPVQGRNLPALMAAYQQMKNEQIAKNASAQQTFPKTFKAGEFAGALPTAIGTGGASPSLGGMAAQGAIAGAGNYTGSNPNPTVGGTAVNAGIGGAIGAAIPAAINAVPGVGRSVLNSLRGSPEAEAASGMADVASPPEGMQSFGPNDMSGQVKTKSPLPSNMQEQLQAGKEGINTSSPEAQQKILPEESNKSSDYLTKKILNTHQELMNETTQALHSATEGGMSIDHSSLPSESAAEDVGDLDKYEGQDGDAQDGTTAPDENAKKAPFAQAFDDLEGLVNQESSYNDASTQDGQFASKLFKKITKFKQEEAGEEPSSLVDQHGQPLVETSEADGDADYRTQLSPMETKNLMDDVYKYSKVLNKNDQPELGKIAYNFYKGLRDRLRTEVPDYADAADRLTQFQKYIPETLMSEGNTAADSGVRLSDSNSKYMDIKNSAQDLISNLAKDGTSTYPAKQTYNQLEQSLDTLGPLERARQAEAQLQGKPFESIFEKMGMNEEQMLKFLRDKSVRARAYDQMKTGTIPLNPSSMQKVASTVRDFSDVIANKVGSLMSNAPTDVLYAASEKLSKNPATASLGAGLKTALAGTDVVKRNAAIFAILQNPTAKAIIDPDIKNTEQQASSVPKRSPYNTEF